MTESNDKKLDGRFSEELKLEVAARSAYFCNNPLCNRLLRAPLEKNATGPLKLGQVAHIYGNRHGSERHVCHDNPALRAQIENAIFLCGACHDMIDKRGACSKSSGFSAQEIISWRDDHYEVVQEALTGSYNLFSLIRRQSQAATAARELLTDMADKRVFFDPPHDEDWSLVVKSLKEFRTLIKRIQTNSLPDDPVRSPADGIQKVIHRVLSDFELDKDGRALDEADAQDSLKMMRRRLKKHIYELARASGIPVPANLVSLP